MKHWLMVVAAAVLLWIGATGTASALPDCLKDPAFCRTGVITVMDCDMNCGYCGNCLKNATATLIDVDGADGIWLTSLHAVAGMERIWIDGCTADILRAGCSTAVEPKCDNMDKYGCNWAVLRTSGYIPCGACPATPIFDGPCCGQELFFVDIGKCGTVVKCHVVALPADSAEFYTNTQPDGCWNCGAGVYDHCGRLVGLLVGDGTTYCSDGCNGCGDKDRRTKFIRLDERMFFYLNDSEPTNDGEDGLKIPAAPA